MPSEKVEQSVFRTLTDEEYGQYVSNWPEEDGPVPSQARIVHMKLIVPRGIAEAILAVTQDTYSLYSSPEDFIIESLRRRIIERKAGD